MAETKRGPSRDYSDKEGRGARPRSGKNPSTGHSFCAWAEMGVSAASRSNGVATGSTMSASSAAP